ncbi:MAG TPA: TerC family protein [Rhizomicrobium sp.]
MQDSPAFVALLQVILIDLVLAGDNAVVIGMAAARIPSIQRRKVIFWGMSAAVVLRIILALLTATILNTIGLMFAGGILLLWVSWRLYRDLHPSPDEAKGLHTISGREVDAQPRPPLDTKHVRLAILRIVVADLSMSLDNVLAVAGAAMNHPLVLGIGLVLSIALMGVAAAMIANLLARHPWLSYAGLIIVVYVAIRMIWFGGLDLFYRGDQPPSSTKTAVASSLVLNRGYAMPSGSPASMPRNSSPRDFKPFAWAAAMSPSAS